MFILDRDVFRGAKRELLLEFVTCWERYYRDAPRVSPTGHKKIDYYAELNITSKLTEQNVIRLLRWKDIRMLTHPMVSGQPNPRVVNVLEHLDALNRFRNDDIGHENFLATARMVFPSGLIWQAFLCHIARPWEWPIADQHVFRARSALFGMPAPASWLDLSNYRMDFQQLADLLPKPSAEAREAEVRRNKRLDNALMAYGQFLLRYDR